jgi:hypothetical protein
MAGVAGRAGQLSSMTPPFDSLLPLALVEPMAAMWLTADGGGDWLWGGCSAEATPRSAQRAVIVLNLFLNTP